MPIPIIVGFGGVNAAGRSSFHHAFSRLVHENLPLQTRQKTFVALASLMGLVKHENKNWINNKGEIISETEILEQYQENIIKNTLIREIHPTTFDTGKVFCSRTQKINASADNQVSFTIPYNAQDKFPPQWKVEVVDSENCRVTIEQDFEVSVPSSKNFSVKVAGQLPLGFDLSGCYSSHRHPKSLQLAVFAASDALQSVGLDWDEIHKIVPPDKIGVYASSSKGQIDEWGTMGYVRAPLQGKKPTSKQMPFSFADMPADFVNAYVLGNVGTTMSCVGACATFLYNLKIAISDIQNKKVRIAVVGCAEAPLSPEIMEAYQVMNALADESKLRKIDGLTKNEKIDYSKASRPFGNNCGFVLSESGQFIVLFDDELVIETGANIYGAIGEVFTHADGFKRSISQPGIGNYITLSKACAAATKILSEIDVQRHSYIHAHGSSTPQNRVTESKIFEKIAQVFGINNWPICAIKCYLGHPTGPASGDQLIAALGAWAVHTLPGIATQHIADDVHQKGLDFLLKHRQFDPHDFSLCFINSKGFGGNNATGIAISPQATQKLLYSQHTGQVMSTYQKKLNKTIEKQQAIENDMIKNCLPTLYKFGTNIINEDTLSITKEKISIPGKLPISYE